MRGFSRVPNVNGWSLGGIIHREPQSGVCKDEKTPWRRIPLRVQRPYYSRDKGHMVSSYSFYVLMAFGDRADYLAEAKLGDGIYATGHFKGNTDGENPKLELAIDHVQLVKRVPGDEPDAGEEALDDIPF